MRKVHKQAISNVIDDRVVHFYRKQSRHFYCIIDYLFGDTLQTDIDDDHNDADD